MGKSYKGVMSMKNSMSKAVWGVFFVLLGIALAGRALGVFNFNFYFPGWWTLFIIIPSAIGLVNRENRSASIFGLGIGILLMASAQGIIDWDIFPKLIIALIFIAIGSSFLFRRDRSDRRENYNSKYSYDTEQEADTNQEYDANQEYNANQGYHSKQNSDGTNDDYFRSTNHGGYNHYAGILSGRNIQLVDEEFKGADVTSILGNVQLDLRNAILKDDVVIETTCILGGVDIYVPINTKVVFNCTPILGGVENKVISPYNPSDTTHTIFIRGTCILGGIEVK
jgi:predicted membrane protein